MNGRAAKRILEGATGLSQNKRKFLFTSESVTEGHPDKIADQISDAVLDAVLAEDAMGRVACETLVTTGLAMVAGEITTSAVLDYSEIVRDVIRDVGYTRAKYGFDAETCAVISSIKRQSPDIAMGVDTGGAGDQGLMFGYACDETDELMPLPIMLAHKLVRRLSRSAQVGQREFPAARRQVAGHRGICGRPAGARGLRGRSPRSTATRFRIAELHEAILKEVIQHVVPESLMDSRTKFHINPTGRFVVGGPMGDAGLTGRKIIVDTYGGYSRHGGGAFSGKDPTKVDRSACYMARYVAKNLVAAGLAHARGSAAGLRHRRGRAGLGDGRYASARARFPTSR